MCFKPGLRCFPHGRGRTTKLWNKATQYVLLWRMCFLPQESVPNALEKPATQTLRTPHDTTPPLTPPKERIHPDNPPPALAFLFAHLLAPLHHASFQIRAKHARNCSHGHERERATKTEPRNKQNEKKKRRENQHQGLVLRPHFHPQKRFNRSCMYTLRRVKAVCPALFGDVHDDDPGR